MIEKLSEALNAISRVPTQLLVVVAVAAGLVLFFPEKLASTLAVDDFRKTYRLFVGPAFLLVMAWLVARLFTTLARPLQKRARLRKLHKRLEMLTPEEKGYLAPYVEKAATTINVAVEDGIIGGLLARGIVYRSSNVFDLVDGVPYNLQPWARAHLQSNVHLLEGAVGGPVSPREKRSADRW